MARTLTFTLAALFLVACEGPMGPEGPPGPQGPAGPQGEAPEPGPPASVVVMSLALDDDGNAVTALANEGGAGEYRLEFYGSRINEPSGCPTGESCCPDDFIADIDPVNVTADYSETVTWGTGTSGRVSTVVAYSRGPDTAAWTESSVTTTCPS